MLIDVETACKQLLEQDNILILAHQKPDGDTLGASFALLWALLSLGKRARVECADGFPSRYGFIYGDYTPDESFSAGYIVTADVAGLDMIAPDARKYDGKVDLCIDHHKSNSMYAKMTLLDAGAPATCQIVYDILACFGVEITAEMANAIFTGLSTDTGCFKYANVTAKTHRVAAKMIERGADHAKINKLMFDTKSRGMMMIDRMIFDTISFFFDGRCAMVTLQEGVAAKFGVTEEELDGISSLPMRIEGVLAGITMRARGNDTYRVSLRTSSPVDASRICERFGGGGHANAAGCTMTGEFEKVTGLLLDAVFEELDQKAS